MLFRSSNWNDWMPCGRNKQFGEIYLSIIFIYFSFRFILLMTQLMNVRQVRIPLDKLVIDSI